MDGRKKILAFCNFYWPEVASTAQIYTELFESLTDEFDITVICSVPCYTGEIAPEYQDRRIFEEAHGGVRILRVPVRPFSKQDKKSRVLNLMDYWTESRALARRLCVVGERFDLVFSFSAPPVLGGMLGAYASKVFAVPFVYGIQDFNPEQTMAVGYAGNPVIHQAMMAFDKSSCSKAACVVVPGRDLQETLTHRFEGERVPESVVINNWTDDEIVVPLSKSDPKVQAFRERYGLVGKFVIMYSGNIGLYYDLENIIKIMGEFNDRDDVVFAFVGAGAVKPKLEEYAKSHNLANVVFIPYQGIEDLPYSLNAANVHLVTNAMGIKGVSVPSKIYGVMATNVPCLGILEEGSEAWRIIEDSGCGALAHTGNYEEISAALKDILSSPQEFVAGHETGRAYLDLHFKKSIAIEMYRILFEELTRDDGESQIASSNSMVKEGPMGTNLYKPILLATGVRFGRGLCLDGAPVIFNQRGATLSIGNNVTIKSNFLSNLVGLYQRSIIVTRAPGAYIRIGNDVGMSRATVYARKGITIGDRTLIGANTKILDNDFHPIEAVTRNELARDEHGGDAANLIPAKEISIGNDCFIGCNVIILKGTKLGDGCVVGAGSVVSGEFGDRCVIVGNPARVIKTVSR